MIGVIKNEPKSLNNAIRDTEGFTVLGVIKQEPKSLNNAIRDTEGVYGNRGLTVMKGLR